jgi:hypothetical protein
MNTRTVATSSLWRMTDPKTVHIWMPDGRSLCDRRASPPAAKTTAEAVLMAEESQSAPVCGACVVIVQSMRSELAIEEALVETIWPDDSNDAYNSLRDTRWATLWAFDEEQKAHSLTGQLKEKLSPAQLEEIAGTRRSAQNKGLANLRRKATREANRAAKELSQ